MENLDIRIAKSIQEASGARPEFWHFFARYALYAYVIVIAVFGSLMPLTQALTELFVPAVAAFAGAAMLQHIIRRERPVVTKTDFRQWLLTYSFPSAHASTSFAFAAVLSTASLHLAPEAAPIFIPAAYILALGIALSRVVVGVHHPSDVLAGAVFGSAIGLLFVTL